MGMLSAVFWTALDNAVPAEISLHAETRMTVLICGLLALTGIAAVALAPAREPAQRGGSRLRMSEIVAGLLLSVCSIAFIWQYTLRPAWADIAYRIAGVYESGGNLPGATELYERASDLAPHVVAYRISLGLAQGATVNSDQERIKQASLSLENALDINPLDFESCRTVGAFHMQAGERSSDPAFRADEINTAISLFRKASRLAPNYPDAYSEIGRCLFLQGNDERANAMYQKSLQLNPGYWRTYMFLGEMHYRRTDLKGALQYFTDSVRLNGSNIEGRKNIGFVLALLGRREEAIRANLETLGWAPRDAMLLTRLSVLYFSAGNYAAGIDFGRRAYEATPASGRPSLAEFIEKLKNAN
jgi:tetratricopeptide (TPR) repeat protein